MKSQAISKSFALPPFAIAAILSGAAQIIMVILGIASTVVSLIASYQTFKDRLKEKNYQAAKKELENMKEEIEKHVKK